MLCACARGVGWWLAFGSLASYPLPAAHVAKLFLFPSGQRGGPSGPCSPAVERAQGCRVGLLTVPLLRALCARPPFPSLPLFYSDEHQLAVTRGETCSPDRSTMLLSIRDPRPSPGEPTSSAFAHLSPDSVSSHLSTASKLFLISVILNFKKGVILIFKNTLIFRTVFDLQTHREDDAGSLYNLSGCIFPLSQSYVVVLENSLVLSRKVVCSQTWQTSCSSLGTYEALPAARSKRCRQK